MSPEITILYDTIRWEEKALLEAGKKKGINIRMQDCKKIALDLDGDNHNGDSNGGTTDLDAYGTVIQRCVSYYRNIHSTAALEGLGVRMINCLKTGMLAGNKLFTHMLLKKAGVPTPYASVSFSKDAAMQYLDIHGFPMVIKPTVGSWGRLISKINDEDAAEGIMESRERMYPIHQIHYMEEFVQRPPRDIRVIMVGDRAVAAIYRNSLHWKTNMALGGEAEPCDVTPEMEEMCIKAKNAVHGEIVGVDLMESDERGLIVHEVNNTTEYKNTVRVCGVDIPSLMLDYALERSTDR